jgi:predicted nucleic acid-binding protein
VETFFDTSVLVSASERNHPHYAPASAAVRRVTSGQEKGLICAHSIAEVYASLTKLPVQPRIQPDQAARIMQENILPYFTAVPLEPGDYLAALDRVSAGGWSGGKIYDALLLQCAARCKVKRIYTFNLGDFRRLAAPEVQRLIQTPEAT